MEKKRLNLFLGVYYSSILVLILSLLGFAKVQWNDEKQHRQLIEKIDLNTPDSLPPLGQEAIDKALVMYNIKVPGNVSRPIFDAELEDRGITSKAMASNQYKVFIGPSAFESWALLGSTLAHEIEVHCDQSFLLIAILDRFGFDGTSTAERHAYQHELAQADRFGLTQADRYLIQHTADLYYPESGRGNPNRLVSWMAAALKPNVEIPATVDATTAAINKSKNKKPL